MAQSGGFIMNFSTWCSLIETIEQGIVQKRIEHTQKGWFDVIEFDIPNNLVKLINENLMHSA